MRDRYNSDIKLSTNRDTITQLRVRTYDANGVERDLSQLLGDFVEDCEVNHDVDQPVAEARIRLTREIDFFSIAPLIADSALNNLPPRALNLDWAGTKSTGGVGFHGACSAGKPVYTTAETPMLGWSAVSTAGGDHHLWMAIAVAGSELTNVDGGWWYIGSGTQVYNGTDPAVGSWARPGGPLAAGQWVARLFLNDERTLVAEAYFTVGAQLPGALIEEGRRILIDAAWTPGLEDASQVSTAAQEGWHCIFDGVIDDVDWANSPVEITARDRACEPQDAFVERERVYGLYENGYGCLLWREAIAVTTGELILPSKGLEGGGIIYSCQNAGGTTGGTEPVWPTGLGQTVNDNGITWICEGPVIAPGIAVETVLQAMLDQHCPGWTLCVPVSPGWDIGPFILERGGLLEGMRKLALQIGWDLRLAWRGEWSRFDLTLYEPDRAANPEDSYDYKFAVNDISQVRKCTKSRLGVRNVIDVIYSDGGDLDPKGDPKRKRYQWKDDASIDKYGRRYMEIAEASSSRIDGPLEAARMAAACGADLSTPMLDFAVDLRTLWWPIEPADFYKFAADGEHFDQDQTLAVVNFTHRFSREDGGSTQIALRGKPCAGFQVWHDMGGAGRTGAAADQDLGVVSISDALVTVDSGIRGVVIRFPSPSPVLGRAREYELHISTSASFEPSDETLHSVGSRTSFTVNDLDTLATYYGRIVAIDRQGRRSAPSAPFACTPLPVHSEDIDQDLRAGCCAARITSDQTEASRTGKVTLNSEIFDAGGCWDTANTRFDAPAAGVYRFHGRAVVAGLSAGQTCKVALYKNGSMADSGVPSVAAASTDCGATVDSLLDLAKDDLVELYLACSGTGSMTVRIGAQLQVERTLVS